MLLSFETNFNRRCRIISSCTKLSTVGGNDQSSKTSQCIAVIYEVLHQIPFTKHHITGQQWLILDDHKYSLSLSHEVFSLPVCSGFYTFNRDLASQSFRLYSVLRLSGTGHNVTLYCRVWGNSTSLAKSIQDWRTADLCMCTKDTSR